MDATEIIVMVGGTLLLLAIILAFMSAVTRGVLGRVGRRSREAAQQQYPNARLIDAAVSFWGQQSRGVGQVRGNGTLIVTNDAVIFRKMSVKGGGAAVAKGGGKAGRRGGELAVISNPTTEAAVGKTSSYQLETLPDGAGLTFKLEEGPRG